MEPIWRKRCKGEKFSPKDMIAKVFNYFKKSMNVSDAVQEQSKDVYRSERQYII